MYGDLGAKNGVVSISGDAIFEPWIAEYRRREPVIKIKLFPCKMTLNVSELETVMTLNTV